MHSSRHIFRPIIIDIFLNSPQKHRLWYSFEVPHQGPSNEYPQHIFSWRNKNNTGIGQKKSALTLKEPITTAADNNFLFIFFLFFRENKS